MKMAKLDIDELLDATSEMTKIDTKTVIKHIEIDHLLETTKEW